MIRILLKIFDFLKTRKLVCALSFLVVSVLLVFQVMQLNYKEDISDFLPLEGNNLKALKVYQDIAGANKLIVSFSYKDSTKTDPDTIVECITNFVDDLTVRDKEGLVHDLVDEIDMEKFASIANFVYQNIPYFLNETDYAHIDSILANPSYITQQLEKDKQMLMFPMGGLFSENLSRDPLNLFTPVVSLLQNSSGTLHYELYEGCIFTPDMKRGLVTLSSPFGSSETENNGRLIALLEASTNEVTKHHADIEARIIGGPVIAVGNAQQIKTDSVLSVVLAVTLILLLLWLCFRNLRNLLLIALSIGWGWLFAMGGLALVHDDISVIVIGISSVILGIAVNYPLHLIAHLSHTPDMRSALKEIISPLIVGNITTVGAFLSLVPLESVALKDLGLFSSFLLIGTIVFVLIYLPHVAKVKKEPTTHSFIGKIGNVSLENKPWFIVIVLILTGIFGYFSKYTAFDANMSNINYMTPEQKADMAYMAQMISGTEGTENLYIVSADSTLDGALDKSLNLQSSIKELPSENILKSSGCTHFIVSKAQQQKRLELWNEFIAKHGKVIKEQLPVEMKEFGFSAHSFDDFFTILESDYQPQEFSYFQSFANTIFASNFSIDSIQSQYNVVDVLTLKKEELPQIKQQLESKLSDSFCFDVSSMNSAIANTLSDDFNYIGFACGTIVFFFLWFSLGSIELAILSFIPMIVSWIWILGIMGILGIHFNIVNVILATFIFGQGDDYTIFMTEGSCYEYAYRKKMLASYKNSITISALIMFIGIGTLIFAKHPALFSLAQVTIVGMFSVVLMAYLFPPLFYRWLIKTNGNYRTRPVSLIPVVRFYYGMMIFFVQIATVYVLGTILLELLKPTEKRRFLLRRYITSLFKFDMRHLPGVKYIISNPEKETLDKPALIISNHQSLLDSTCFMALSHKIIFICNERVSNHRIIHKVFQWMEHIVLVDNKDINYDKIRSLVKRGYSICIFPEGKRNNESSIARFHKGAFTLASELKLDIIPVFLHGLNQILPYKECMLFPGDVHVEITKRIDSHYFQGQSIDAIWRYYNHFYKEHYATLKKQYENTAYFKYFVKDRFRYKGADLYHSLSRRLKKHQCYTHLIDSLPDVPHVIIYNEGWGEFALLMALVHPDKQIYNIEKDEDTARLITYSAEDVAKNLHVFTGNLPDELRELPTSHEGIVFEIKGNEIKKLR